MTVNKAELLLLKIGDGVSPAETFSTLGGLRSTRMAINRQPVTNSDVSSQGWRALAERAGTASVRIQGSGVFSNSAADEVLRAQVMSGLIANYMLCFGNGGVMSGAFLVSGYERSGKMGEMEGFSITLESAGSVSYAAP